MSQKKSKAEKEAFERICLIISEMSTGMHGVPDDKIKIYQEISQVLSAHTTHAPYKNVVDDLTNYRAALAFYSEIIQDINQALNIDEDLAEYGRLFTELLTDNGKKAINALCRR